MSKIAEILIKDGVKYRLWTPPDEKKDFEPRIIHHVGDIFGGGCEYFQKAKIETIPGISRIPDGFVIDFKKNKGYIVELKVLGDYAIREIPLQIIDYKAIENRNQLRVISDSIKKQIKDLDHKKSVEGIIFGKDPEIIVIINSLDGKEGKQFKIRAKGADRIVEFKTFARDYINPKSVHIHLITPVIYDVGEPSFHKPKEERLMETGREIEKPIKASEEGWKNKDYIRAGYIKLFEEILRGKDIKDKQTRVKEIIKENWGKDVEWGTISGYSCCAKTYKDLEGNANNWKEKGLDNFLKKKEEWKRKGGI